jgi:hypothetical protein
MLAPFGFDACKVESLVDSHGSRLCQRGADSARLWRVDRLCQFVSREGKKRKKENKGASPFKSVVLETGRLCAQPPSYCLVFLFAFV